MTKDGIKIVTATGRGERRMTRLGTTTYPDTLFYNEFVRRETRLSKSYNSVQ
jgi:hypothetical protein